MISLVVNQLFRSFCALPCVIISGIAAVVAVFGCVKCTHFQIRDCVFCKSLLRWVGHDEFDDFELTVLVHEVTLQGNKHTIVRLKAGSHIVETDPSSDGIFQQPLQLTVQQGVRSLLVEVLSPSKAVLATLPIDVGDVLAADRPWSELVFDMRQKNKGIRNPKIKLSMIPDMYGDAEQALVDGNFQEYVVRQQLDKLKEGVEGKEPERGVNPETEALKHACSGPLEIFKGLGDHRNVHVAVLGPPSSRRFCLGIWPSKQDCEHSTPAIIEVDLLKIQSVQPDPQRKQVFVISHLLDKKGTTKEIRFRIVDRSRDVWVMTLQKMCEHARIFHKTTKAARKTLA